MKRRTLATIAAGVAVLFLTGCSRDSTSNGVKAIPPRLSATDVARVGDSVIGRQAFEGEWERRTEVRSKEELLREMIRFEALLSKARAAGVDRQPEVLVAFNRMVVGKFQEEQLQRRGIASVEVSEGEIREFYESHLDEFTVPQQIRIGIIYCRIAAKATAEKRAELRQRAGALWKQATQTDDGGFGQLALQHSDDQTTRYAGGDTGWFNPEQNDSRWEPEVINAALALSDDPPEGGTPNVAPLLESRSGFYIVKLLGTKPKSHRSLEEVRDGIEYRLRMGRAQQLRESFFVEMQAGLTIEVNQAALDAVPERVMQAGASRPPALPK